MRLKKASLKLQEAFMSPKKAMEEALRSLYEGVEDESEAARAVHEAKEGHGGSSNTRS